MGLGAKFFAWIRFIRGRCPRPRIIVPSFFKPSDTVCPSEPEAWAGGRCCRLRWRDEDGANLGEAAHLHLREPAHRLAPAEAFLDPFAQPLADRIAKARCDLGRDGGLARLAGLADRPVDRHVRLDPARLQAFDEGLGVVVLVGAEGLALGQPLAEAAAASRSAVPVAKVASAPTTSPLRFSINAWPR